LKGKEDASLCFVGVLPFVVVLVTLSIVGASLLNRLPSNEKLGMANRQHFTVMGFNMHAPFIIAAKRRRGHTTSQEPSCDRRHLAAATTPATSPAAVAPGRNLLDVSTTTDMKNRTIHDEMKHPPEDPSHQTLSVDRRPHEQRVAGPRPARRLNHAFRYLYRGPRGSNRHYSNDMDLGHIQDPRQFLLRVGYTEAELAHMCLRFPPLLQLPVTEQLAPKVRFLRETVQIDLSNATERAWVPPEYFGLKLEAVVAPRHAFLMHAKLPCGRQLVESAEDTRQGTSDTTSARAAPELWLQFVKNCRHSTKHFAAFCQSLQAKSTAAANSDATTPLRVYPVITGRHVEAFQTVFARGLLAAARNDLVQPNNTAWQPLHILDQLHSSDLVSLLVAHGANATERDHRGATLLHWACGTGNLRAAQVLSRHLSITAIAERDGATPLHWAAAGATPHEFGTGGHADICQYLMEQVQTTQASSSKRNALREYINRPTKDGNTPLMWAAWSGTVDTVKLLVRSRADVSHRNRNGCTVAHWASSGGNVHVCRYLLDVAEANFVEPNYGGNTPLTHAVAFGRADVVAWLTKEVLISATAVDDDGDAADRTSGDPAIATARNLATNMVRWTGGERTDRNQVLQLFDEWAEYEIGNGSPVGTSRRSIDTDDDTDDDVLLR
jgi:ankyrin repeat protein